MRGLKLGQHVVFKENIMYGNDLAFRQGDVGKITLYDYDEDFIIVDEKGIPLTKKQLRVANIDEIRIWLL